MVKWDPLQRTYAMRRRLSSARRPAHARTDTPTAVAAVAILIAANLALIALVAAPGTTLGVAALGFVAVACGRALRRVDLPAVGRSRSASVCVPGTDICVEA